MKRKLSERELIKRKFRKFLYDNGVLEEYMKNIKDESVKLSWHDGTLRHIMSYKSDKGTIMGGYEMLMNVFWYGKAENKDGIEWWKLSSKWKNELTKI
jgi:hypothetical protein